MVVPVYCRRPQRTATLAGILYNTSKHGYLLLFGGLAALSLLSFVIALLSGSVDTSFAVLWSELTQRSESLEAQVIYELRIPRASAAFIIGAMLALAGVIMQVLLRNPLADPYILGISGGAAVGALSAILLGLGGLWISNAAFGGAIVSILLVFGIANRVGAWSTLRLLLTGVVISAGWGAVINILLTTSSTNTVQSMLFWLMGDLSQSRITWLQPLLLAIGAVGTLYYAKDLNVLARGERIALTLGVNVRQLRLLLYGIASVLTATAVTIAGSVGFVGLIIPHLLRLLGARDHRLLIPCSVLLGGSFLSIADTLSRTLINPQQLPVGVITAIIGVPTFLFILLKNRT